MTDVTVALGSDTNRIYKFRHPLYIPFFAIGTTRDKMKRAGVWEKLPQAIRQKARAAQDGWRTMVITRKDMDAIPDDVWARLARAFDLEWGYAERGR